jgi:hypothetical protein
MSARKRLSLHALLLAGFAAAGCNTCDPYAPLYGEWRYHCGPARAEGEHCEQNDECGGGTFCDTARKVCSDAWLREGEACALGTYACTPGTFCEGGGLVGTCHTMRCDASGACTVGAATGGSCDQSNAETACGAGNTCLLASPTTGSCEPAGVVGESCPGDPASCGAGLFCAIPDQVCLTPPPDGARCVVNESCGPGRFCLTASGELASWEQPGTCQGSPMRPEGAPCLGAVCARGLHCDYSQNRCARDREVGDRCQNGNECGEFPGIARECVRGTCVATDRTGAACWPGPSERCAGALECVSDIPE